MPDSWVFYNAPSVELPAAEGDLWNPALANEVWLQIEFILINNDAGAAGAAGTYVGREVNSVGGLARPYYWMFNETIPHPGTSGWRGPFYIHGDDAVRGYTTNANEVSIHFKVRRIL
jgi:hypothetical protein